MTKSKQVDVLARTLLDIFRKEGSMIEVKREISKELAERAIHENNWEGIFDISEVCGYGVYGSRIIEEDGKYYVQFSRGETCD